MEVARASSKDGGKDGSKSMAKKSESISKQSEHVGRQVKALDASMQAISKRKLAAEANAKKFKHDLGHMEVNLENMIRKRDQLQKKIDNDTKTVNEMKWRMEFKMEKMEQVTADLQAATKLLLHGDGKSNKGLRATHRKIVSSNLEESRRYTSALGSTFTASSAEKGLTLKDHNETLKSLQR